jgi:hypothetical protein
VGVFWGVVLVGFVGVLVGVLSRCARRRVRGRVRRVFVGVFVAVFVGPLDGVKVDVGVLSESESAFVGVLVGVRCGRVFVESESACSSSVRGSVRGSVRDVLVRCWSGLSRTRGFMAYS